MRGSTLARWAATLAAAATALGIAAWQGRQPAPEQVDAPPPAPDPTAVQRDIDLCAERLARLGQALKLYGDDNGGAFPIGDMAGDADVWLPAVLEADVADFHCPTAGATGPPYVYHCYTDRGPGNWSRWMLPEHIVDQDSGPDTWLVADYLDRDTEGPHAQYEKAFNYLTADGRVSFHQGRPRDVYK